MQDDKDMAPAARVSRRKDTAPVEVDAAAVLLGLKQPLFASQGRSSAASWRGSLATACLAVGCVLVGFMLASVMYERELYHRGVPLHTFVAEKGRFDPSKVPVCAYFQQVHLAFSLSYLGTAIYCYVFTTIACLRSMCNIIVKQVQLQE